MSKLFAILLSSLILLQSLRIEYNDIIQIDDLIEHAQFHKAEYGDNFFVFISKHYGELKDDHSKNHQEEEKDHDQLPFQCHDHIVTITAFVIQKCFLEIESVELLELKDSRFHYQSTLSTLHKKSLLQPPKLA
ncbi:hypothetical protein [Psychroserpens mesophilus]|uniref:hypothetical protein n=1 Tax=Psychroserpens mesophilus TaxID=325473 RepID=UPI003D661D28